MKVVTLNRERFAEACGLLEREAEQFAPDVVAGIATGGVYVAERMFPSVAHVSVVCRRASSARKDRAEGAFRVVRRLPLWVRNALRMVEARLLGARPHSTAVDVPVEAAEVLAGARRVLIVDDAVDSGTTLAAVTEAVRGLNPGCVVASAVVAVTTARPLVVPEFALYRNGTLIRFPWSKDFSEGD